MADTVLVIHERDNVAVALRDLAAGEEARLRGKPLATALEPIPASHKVALHDMAQGESVIKYGETVGVTTEPIRKGAWVHTHNLRGG